jgi:hypothetical protein
MISGAFVLVFLMGFAVGAAMALLTWGLFLEARSNREWRESLSSAPDARRQAPTHAARSR